MNLEEHAVISLIYDTQSDKQNIKEHKTIYLLISAKQKLQHALHSAPTKYQEKKKDAQYEHLLTI